LSRIQLANFWLAKRLVALSFFYVALNSNQISPSTVLSLSQLVSAFSQLELPFSTSLILVAGQLGLLTMVSIMVLAVLFLAGFKKLVFLFKSSKSNQTGLGLPKAMFC
jgi:hypothetical protein